MLAQDRWQYGAQFRSQRYAGRAPYRRGLRQGGCLCRDASGTSRRICHPKDFTPNYVSHIEFDGAASGKNIAEILFKTIGGKGGIVALGGLISTTAAINRKKGLDAALAAQSRYQAARLPPVANWKSTEAFDLTGNLLTRFGKDIKGIWGRQ